MSVPSQYSVDVFEHTQVATVMDPNPVSLSFDTPFEELVRRISSHDPALGGHHAHPVLDGKGRLLGIITRGDVVRGIETACPEAGVGDFATTKLVTVGPADSLHDAILKMLANDVGRLPVVAGDDGGILLGYLSRSAILSARAKVIDAEIPCAAWQPWKRTFLRKSDRTGKT